MTVEIVDTKELRRLAQAATPGGWYVERWNHIYGCKEVTDGEEKWHPVIACTDDDEVDVNFEANASFIAAANPAAISELLDRIEAAETELAELRSSMKFRTSLIGRTEAERDALRAKIEQMERQVPVAKVESWTNGSYTRHYKLKWLRDVGEGAALYALPGAQTQGEEK